MRAPKEYRHWVNRLRRRFAGRNGVVSACLFDHPKMEIKAEKSDKMRKRDKRVVVVNE